MYLDLFKEALIEIFGTDKIQMSSTSQRLVITRPEARDIVVDRVVEAGTIVFEVSTPIDDRGNTETHHYYPALVKVIGLIYKGELI